MFVAVKVVGAREAGCSAVTCAEGHLTRSPSVQGQRGTQCYSKIGTSAIAEENLMVLLLTLNATE